MTIYRTLLRKGYFPKELPPAFSSEQFAAYAGTQTGRRAIDTYKPSNNSTECVAYQLALPGLERRQLRIPHPASFAQLAALTSKHLKRLLKLSGASPFSRSRPVYSSNRYRAIGPAVKPANLARERAGSRAAASYLLRVDISQFYPSLYTHALGWAIDPQLRKRANWNKEGLLGKRLDRALMNLQGKVSQGVPIGNDVSFLLAEVVLARVDRKLGRSDDRSYRWFDDYEFACDTKQEAEELLARLVGLLHAFRLRLNPHKTEIVALPRPSQERWQQVLLDRGTRSLSRANEMVQYFDTAFELRQGNPSAPILLYALGLLFRLRRPTAETARVAHSGVTQALMCEPGCAQKAFALLTFWGLNGFDLDLPLLARTVGQMIVRHRSSGVSSDIAWALSFCLEHGLQLESRAASVLSSFADDCILVLALDALERGLLPTGFSVRQVARVLKEADLDGDHWLAGYETARHGFVGANTKAVRENSLFANMLTKTVTFYRRRLPRYASIVHPGGAPEWVLRQWLSVLQGEPSAESALSISNLPTLGLIEADFPHVKRGSSKDDLVVDLLDVLEREDFEAVMASEEPYS